MSTGLRSSLSPRGAGERFGTADGESEALSLLHVLNGSDQPADEAVVHLVVNNSSGMVLVRMPALCSSFSRRASGRWPSLPVGAE